MKFLVFYGELRRESETYALKAEDNQERDASMSMFQSRRQSKNEAKTEVNNKDISRLECLHRHQNRCEETAESIQALADRQKIC